MPGEADDDYDGVDVFGTKEGGRTRRRGRWNRFKWCLFVANFVVSISTLVTFSSLVVVATAFIVFVFFCLRCFSRRRSSAER